MENPIRKKINEDIRYFVLLILLAAIIIIQFNQVYPIQKDVDLSPIEAKIQDNNKKLDTLYAQINKNKQEVKNIETNRVSNYETYNNYIINSVNANDSVHASNLSINLSQIDSLWKTGYFYSR
jgi:cell division protein FtsB